MIMLKSTTRRLLIRFIFILLIPLSLLYVIFRFTDFQYLYSLQLNLSYRQRSGCSCSRPALSWSPLNQNKAPLSLCSEYATHRGPNQRIISISLFGPKENRIFQTNRSLTFLNELINDMNKIYSDGYVLRIHHDDTINMTDVICPIECKNPNVDFCDMSKKRFIPPKIWRFLPAGDPFVDIMMSRDLDSALTPRERASVNAWLASNKSFHAMRDHPQHGVPMLGGMWGFRPSFDPSMTQTFREKIHNQQLISRYGGRGDQTFLSQEIWGRAKSSILVHDSFLCRRNFGHKPEPFPTQRSSANETNCFVGCVRPCCGSGKMPFPECPKECRPADHPDWNYC